MVTTLSDAGLESICEICRNFFRVHAGDPTCGARVAIIKVGGYSKLGQYKEFHLPVLIHAEDLQAHKEEIRAWLQGIVKEEYLNFPFSKCFEGIVSELTDWCVGQTKEKNAYLQEKDSASHTGKIASSIFPVRPSLIASHTGS